MIMGREISIVLCCHNSSQRLPATLLHLSKLKIDEGLSWEIVLVDNASTDNTGTTANSLWTELGSKCSLNIVTEEKRGVHHARITGMRAAQYDLVVFCDDDNWLSANYLMVALSVMSERQIGVCGGRGKAVFEEEEPEWFARYEGVFGCGRQGRGEGVLNWDAIGMYSAGMVIRKSIVLNLFDAGYQARFAARNDKGLSGGEDFELVVLVRTAGYKAYYTDSLVFEHYMPAGRMSWDYLKRLVKGATVNAAIAYVYADTLRYIYTNDKRYRVSWVKDILKAVYGFFLVKIKSPRDLQIAWIRMAGNICSVLGHKSRYSLYKAELKRVFDLTHHKD